MHLGPVWPLTEHRWNPRVGCRSRSAPAAGSTLCRGGVPGEPCLFLPVARFSGPCQVSGICPRLALAAALRCWYCFSALCSRGLQGPHCLGPLEPGSEPWEHAGLPPEGRTQQPQRVLQHGWEVAKMRRGAAEVWAGEVVGSVPYSTCPLRPPREWLWSRPPGATARLTSACSISTRSRPITR